MWPRHLSGALTAGVNGDSERLLYIARTASLITSTMSASITRERNVNELYRRQLADLVDNIRNRLISLDQSPMRLE